MIKVVFEKTFEDNNKVQSSQLFKTKSTDLIECMKQLDEEIEDLKGFMQKHVPRLVRVDVIKFEFV